VGHARREEKFAGAGNLRVDPWKFRGWFHPMGFVRRTRKTPAGRKNPARTARSQRDRQPRDAPANVFDVPRTAPHAAQPMSCPTAPETPLSTGRFGGSAP
jgi:hypothetical protein